MLFISHSSKDKPTAEALGARLRDHGYDDTQIFLDSDSIQPGEEWERVLYLHLRRCRALIVLYSENWKASRWCFAELVHAKQSGKHILPLVIEPIAIEAAVGERQAIRAYEHEEEACGRLIRWLEELRLGPRNSFHWDPRRCPYPGFASFSEDEGAVYFGREREIDDALDRLNQMHQRGEPRWLMIVGGSGAGKSSLLRAGIVPRLRATPRRTDWIALPALRFGREKGEIFARLASDLTSAFGRDTRPDWARIRDELETLDADLAARRLADVCRGLVNETGSDVRVLIVIDQFEELLATSVDDAARRFLGLLRGVCGIAGAPVHVLATMRADYLEIYERHADAVKHPTLASQRIEPLPPERVPEVIEKPAELCGVNVESALVERLRNDMLGNLPQLAFVLRRLYQRHGAGGSLSVADYEASGGIEGAVRAAVRRAFGGAADDTTTIGSRSLPASDAAALRSAFIRHLVQVNETGAFVRRVARWHELPAPAQRLLEPFVEERLLTKDNETIEVAHEELFRSWEELAGWLADSAKLLRWRAEVQQDRALDDKRWTGINDAQLEVARRWPLDRSDELEKEETRWIDAALARRRRIRVAIGAVAALLSVLAVVATLGWRKAALESENAERATEYAEQRHLEAERSAALSRAVAADALAHTRAAELRAADAAIASAHEWLERREPPPSSVLRSVNRTLRSLAASDPIATGDKQRFVALSSSGIVLGISVSGRATLWDLRSKAVVQELAPEDGGGYLRGVLASSLPLVALVREDGTVDIHDYERRLLSRHLELPDRQVHVVSLSPSGARLLTLSARGERDPGMHVWTSGGPIALAGAAEPVWHAAWSTSETLLVLTTESGPSHVFRTDNGVLLARIEGPFSLVRRLDARPDGTVMATVATGEDVPVSLMLGVDPAELEGAEFLAPTAEQRWYFGDIDRDSKTGEPLSPAERPYFWNMPTGILGPRLDAGVSFTTDAFYGEDAAVATYYEISSGKRVPLVGHRDVITSVTWDEGNVLTTSEDDTAILWNPFAGVPVRILDLHGDDVVHATIDPSLDMVATASLDGNIRLWTMAEPDVAIARIAELPRELVHDEDDASEGRELEREPTGAIAYVAFVPDDGTLAVLSHPGEFANLGDGTALSFVSPATWEIERTIHFELPALLSLDDMVVLGPRGRLVLFAGGDGSILAIDGSSGALLVQLEPATDPRSAIRTMHERAGVDVASWAPGAGIWPSGDRRATVVDGRPLILDHETGRDHPLPLPTRCPTDPDPDDADSGDTPGGCSPRRLVLSPDGALIASNEGIVWSADGVLVHDLHRPSISSGALGELRRGEHPATYFYTPRVRFSPTGRYLAVVALDKEVVVHETHGGAVVSHLVGHGDVQRDPTYFGDGGKADEHDGVVLDVSFGHDESVLITRSNDTTARLWEIESGELLAVFEGQDRGLTSVALSADERFVATAAYDPNADYTGRGAALVFAAALPGMLRQLCGRMGARLGHEAARSCATVSTGPALVARE